MLKTTPHKTLDTIKSSQKWPNLGYVDDIPTPAKMQIL
jgi:hypothetical protein